EVALLERGERGEQLGLVERVAAVGAEDLGDRGLALELLHAPRAGFGLGARGGGAIALPIALAVALAVTVSVAVSVCSALGSMSGRLTTRGGRTLALHRDLQVGCE